MKHDFSKLKSSFLNANDSLSKSFSYFTDMPKTQTVDLKQATDQILSSFDEPLPAAKNLKEMNENLAQTVCVLREQLRITRKQAEFSAMESRFSKIISIISLIIAALSLAVAIISLCLSQ